MQQQFIIGRELGRKHYAEALKKGKRWQSRNIPKWMFDNTLLVPFFTTEVEGKEYLYIFQMPIATGEKVHFILFATCEANSSISDST